MGTDPSLPKSLGACRERKRSVREGQTLSVGRPKPPCGESADPVSPPPGKPPRGQSVAGTVPRASVKLRSLWQSTSAAESAASQLQSAAENEIIHKL